MGRAPHGAHLALASAKITPLAKPGRKVRPIAIGIILRRLTTKTAAKVWGERIAAVCKPHQYGVDEPGGAEKLHKLVTAHLQIHKGDGCLSVDVANAFNSAGREEALTEAQESLPGFAPWLAVWSCDSPTHYCPLASGDVLTQLVQSGFDQGCAMSKAFALTIRRALNRTEAAMKAVDPNAQLVAYMDDITLLGSPGALAGGFEVLRDELLKLKLKLEPTHQVRDLATSWHPKASAVRRACGRHAHHPPADHLVRTGHVG
jgi:hypothetical protein